MNRPHLILGVGEVLWDILPDGARLGGAPANFAVMASRLCNHAAILSRVGRDAMGQRAAEFLGRTPVDASFLEIDPAHPTGTVTVDLATGEPKYTIQEPAAWDFLEPSDTWIGLAKRADALCFGTLAQRSAQSRQTIQTIVAETPQACLRVFDVNLRPPFYSSEILQESLELATILKMNETEAPLVLQLLGLPARETPPRKKSNDQPTTLLDTAQSLLIEFPDLTLIVITRGSHGSLLVTRDEWHQHPGFPVSAADTVGAGDALTAAIVHYLLRGAGLATLNEAGNRWGAWMASQSGAMPELPAATYESISAAIESAR